MKSFKLMVAYIAAVTMLFTSCSKEETDSPVVNGETATLSFGATLNNLLNNRAQTKQHFSDLPECSDAAPATVRVVLSEGGVEMDPVILNVLSDDLDNDGNMDYYTDYSEDLELTPGTYELEEFIVYDASSNIIWIAPIDADDSGDFDGYVMDPLPMTIELGPGVKKYVDVEVLCYDNRMVNQYGYLFFDIISKELYDLCFFVNYCTENGRHYTANYSLNLWYVGNNNSIALYEDSELSEEMLGVNQYGDYYANPMCLVVPAPSFNEAADEDYLYYEITILDWDGNYGDVEDGAITKSGYLSWEDVEGLFDADNSDYTDYWHVFVGCGQDDDGGNGNGNGGNECDTTDPTADCDDDGILNECDPDAAGWAQWDCDNDGVPNGEDDCENTAEGVDVDENGCPVEEEEGCLGEPGTGCITASFSGTVNDAFPVPFFYDGTEVGTMTFTIDAEGNLTVGVIFLVTEGWGMDGLEVSVGENTAVCFDTSLQATSYQEVVDGDFSYSLDISLRANLCQIVQ
ncbi:hypothetical protein [Zunongwangia sp. H14]|uniref:hypothetical protein n=1 Tax=Zunongwangia sp. H14 TaxID=3240792 RepID=UPI003563D7A2